MRVSLKPLSEQVIVLTGASSGIGLATARAASRAGARLVLVARNKRALDAIVHEIREAGGAAMAVRADVAHVQDMERVAARAVEAFGGFDSWINNAGVGLYGTLDQIPLADQHRLFAVNYWGVVHGSLVAARHLRARGGGAIVTTGSLLGDMALVLQGPYVAAKAAVRGFVDTLRMELEHEGAPIAVTLIRPSAIDTPFFDHARLHLDAAGIRNPPPAYDPALVAKAILHACAEPRRDLVVGVGGWAPTLLARFAPGLSDRLIEGTMSRFQQSDDPGRPGRRDNLYAPRQDGTEHSGRPGMRRTSLLLEAQLRPGLTLALAAGAGYALARLAGVGRRRRR